MICNNYRLKRVLPPSPPSRTASQLADHPHTETVALVSGYRTVYLVSAVLLAVAAALTLVLLRRHLPPAEQSPPAATADR